jgi:murein DD-endopeptidase MepM/ murein hydrolase activator NlpD
MINWNNQQRNVVKRLAFLALILSNLATAAGVFAYPLSQEYPEYIVQQGDTLDLIARRFNVSLEELQNINAITDINSIMSGQRLLIPGLEGVTGLLTSQTIRFGTSMSILARMYQTHYENIIKLNHLTSPSEVIAGIDFIIPIKAEMASYTPLQTPSFGDTAIETAIKSNNSQWLLLEENYLKGRWDIIPGEVLFSQESEDNSQSSASLPEFIINNLPVTQGETLEIHVVSDTPAEMQGSFLGDPLVFNTENQLNHYSFYGVHALTEPGIYPMEIIISTETNAQLIYEQPVFLVAGGYGNEWVNVPDDYLDEDAIAEEDAYLLPILTQVSPKRYWNGLFQYPVDEPCVGSLFGQRRDYNAGDYFFYHTGIDFPVCAPNLNIYAPAAGQVVVAEELYVKGKAIVIDHGWGVFSIYAHLLEFNVNVGDMVQPGDLIGLIGNTGRSAGPHLHFEIDILGNPINPLTWLEQEFP